jgi:hypothetical protein
MDTITGAGVHRLCAAGRLMMRRFPPIKLSLGFLMFGETNRLVIVRRIELGSVDSPSRVFEYAIDLADAGRWQSQGNHLADTHGDIPAHHLDTGRRKRFVESLFGELRIEFAKPMAVSRIDPPRSQISWPTERLCPGSRRRLWWRLQRGERYPLCCSAPPWGVELRSGRTKVWIARFPSSANLWGL